MPHGMCSLSFYIYIYITMLQTVFEYARQMWGVQYYPAIDEICLTFCKEMLGVPPNDETGPFPQWLRIYWSQRLSRYSRTLLTGKGSGRQAFVKLSGNIPSATMFIPCSEIGLHGVKKDLQEL